MPVAHRPETVSPTRGLVSKITATYTSPSGILAIQNIVNGKVYVEGVTDLVKEGTLQLEQLKQGRHKNPHLQNSWNKYGGENFKLCILERCTINDLSSSEEWWAAGLEVYKHGYNIRRR